jgi:riboflavin kinase/FMN adenylyltransferase
LKVFTNINENIPKNCVVTVGFFDGVHLGHQYLLKNLIAEASKTGNEELVITLWPHPSIVFGRPIELLNSLEEKIEQIKVSGVRNLLILKFDEALAKYTAGQFVNKILYDALGCSAVIMGYNNSFGNKLGSEQDVEIPSIPTTRLEKFVKDGFDNINSSQIRQCLQKGNVDNAAIMLGYNYSLSGKVISGYKIGRKIGFPTANLGDYILDKIIPANGVYIVKAHFGEDCFPAMLNIGVRPSFEGTERSIEFHIPDFDGDLYDAEVKIEFYKRIREEKKFSDINDLVNQLMKDKQETKAFFS